MNEISDLYEFGSVYAQTYSSACDKCGQEIQVSAQKDDFPEYYTHIHVKCSCGGSAKFCLPVN